MLRRFTDFILQGRLQAVGTALVCALPSIAIGENNFLLSSLAGLLSTLSIVIAAFITLRKGAWEGLLVAIAATIPVLLGDFKILANVSLSATDLLLMLLASNFLTWLFAFLLRKYASWSILLEATAFICITVVIAAHTIYPDLGNWWTARLTAYFADVVQAINQLNPADAQAEADLMQNVVVLVKPYVTGILVSFVAFNALLQVLVARAWLIVESKQKIGKELRDIHLSVGVSVMFILGLILAYCSNSAALADSLPVLYFIFGLAGLSLLHAVCVTVKNGWIWLALGYVVITFLGMVPVALAAVLDAFLDLRKRVKN